MKFDKVLTETILIKYGVQQKNSWIYYSDLTLLTSVMLFHFYGFTVQICSFSKKVTSEQL